MQNTLAAHLKAQVSDNNVISNEVQQVADATVVLGGRIANSMIDIEPAAGPEQCAVSSLRVPAPKAGTEMAYLVNPGTKVQLQGIALADTTRTEDGGNLVIETPNGGKIILLDYVNSAGVEDCEASLTGGKAAPKLVKQPLLAQLPEENLADIAPAAGPQPSLPLLGSDGSGFAVPLLLAGVGTGLGLFSRVGDAFATGRPTVGAAPTTEFFEPSGPTIVPPVVPPVVLPKPVDAVNDSAEVKNCHECSPTTGNKVTINVLANDTDADGSIKPLPAEILSFTNPTNGTVVKNADGTFTYMPKEGFSGDDSFTYTVKNADGQTDTATVSVKVLPCDPVVVPPKPVDAVDDVATTRECISHPGKAVVINVLGNDTDADGSVKPLAAEIIANTQAANGTVVKNADGTFTYTPNAGFDGNDSFTYTVKNADGQTDTATVRITVTPTTVDAVNDKADIARPTGGVVTQTINVGGNDSDAEHDTFSITSFTQPSVGSVVKNADGTFTYTSVAGNTAYETTFTYTITDACGATDTATVTLCVAGYTPPAPKPVDAVNDSATVQEECGCQTTARKSVTINVLNNDTDADGSIKPLAAEITSFTQAANGTVVKNADGTFTYSPNAQFDGVDSFTYTVTNADGQTDTATVSITVLPSTVDAVNDHATVARPTGGVVTQVINVIGNDTDPEGQKFDVTSFTQPSVGSVVKNADGTFTYSSVAGNAAYETTFTYTITDSCGATDTATVTVKVDGYVPPVRPVDAVDDYATVQEECGCQTTARKSVTINVLNNDTDADGSIRPLAAEITGFTQPLNGTVVKNADGTFTYSPNAQFDGWDYFGYAVTNADGQTDSAYVRIQVLPSTVDARDDVAHVSRSIVQHPYGAWAPYYGYPQYTAPASLVIRAKDNDIDPEGQKFDITSFSQPAVGSVVKNADGTFTYTADANRLDAYSTSFTYTVTDSCGATDTATVTVHVPAVSIPLPPVVEETPPTTGPDSGTGNTGGGDTGGDCPLVIDMDGNGLQTIAQSVSQANFDLNNDGATEHTAWFGATEGILVRDTNANGQVDGISELFNNREDANGFAHLARTMDSNADGVVDSNDAGWGQLQVWFDANGNAASEAGEMVSLNNAGIASIRTATEGTAVYYENAYMPVASVVTMTDGSTRMIGDIFFTNANDGQVTGAATNDMLVHSATAATYNGAAGTDTLWLQQGGNTVQLGSASGLQLNSVEAINSTNGRADTLNLNLADVLAFNEDGILTVTGDVADTLNLTGATRGTDVLSNGATFASYTAANGAEVLVSAGMTVNLEEHRCVAC